LARFNTQVGKSDKRYFQGLPSPAAAGIVAAGVWMLGSETVSLFTVGVALVVTLLAGLLMVSNFRFHSFKEVQLKDRVPFVTLLVIVGVGIVLLIDPASLLLFALLAYAASGPLVTFVGLKERRMLRVKSKRAATTASETAPESTTAPTANVTAEPEKQ